jgi:anti-repressor protein
MNELKVFINDNFGDVRVLQNEDEIWFVAKDVCDCLEIQNTTDAIKRLEFDEVTRFNLGGKVGEVNLVNEYGLYNLVLGSRKPEAKQFKRWITHEVIPAIRKTGGYIATHKDSYMIDDPIERAMAWIKEYEEKQQLLTQIKEDKPKVLFADAVTASHTSILVGELAKIMRQNGVEIGQNRFFEWLRENSYLIKRRGTDYNMPTQKAMELQLFEVKETSISHSDGHISISKTPKVTGKGQVYFINKLSEAV